MSIPKQDPELVKYKVKKLAKEKGWYIKPRTEAQTYSKGQYKINKKNLYNKIKHAGGYSYKKTPPLATDYKYEILQHTDNDYAFRVFKKRNEEVGLWCEFWLHPSPKEGYWDLYPKADKRYDLEGIRDWDNTPSYSLYWDDDKNCFTKGVAILPLEIVEIIEMFNILVRKSKHGFDESDDARIIYGESPFEESHD